MISAMFLAADKDSHLNVYTRRIVVCESNDGTITNLSGRHHVIKNVTSVVPPERFTRDFLRDSRVLGELSVVYREIGHDIAGIGTSAFGGGEHDTSAGSTYS